MVVVSVGCKVYVMIDRETADAKVALECDVHRYLSFVCKNDKR